MCGGMASVDDDIKLIRGLIEWADTIFVMERQHRSKLQKQFRTSLKDKRIVCLDIPDDYEFMDPDLVRLLEARLARHIPATSPTP